jgi:hypothetical protein
MAGGNSYMVMYHSVPLSLTYTGHSAMHEVFARVVVYRGLSEAFLNHTGAERGKQGLEGGKN